MFVKSISVSVCFVFSLMLCQQVHASFANQEGKDADSYRYTIRSVGAENKVEISGREKTRSDTSFSVLNRSKFPIYILNPVNSLGTEWNEKKTLSQKELELIKLTSLWHTIEEGRSSDVSFTNSAPGRFMNWVAEGKEYELKDARHVVLESFSNEKWVHTWTEFFLLTVQLWNVPDQTVYMPYVIGDEKFYFEITISRIHNPDFMSKNEERHPSFWLPRFYNIDPESYTDYYLYMFFLWMIGGVTAFGILRVSAKRSFRESVFRRWILSALLLDALFIFGLFRALTYYGVIGVYISYLLSVLWILLRTQFIFLEGVGNRSRWWKIALVNFFYVLVTLLVIFLLLYRNSEHWQ